MSAQSDQVREQLKNAFSHYKFKDERCGMCRGDADSNLLVKRLSKNLFVSSLPKMCSRLANSFSASPIPVQSSSCRGFSNFRRLKPNK